MTRADTYQTKIHYKGNEDDFVILVESVEAVKKWKEDKTIPLVDVVNSFDVFATHKSVWAQPDVVAAPTDVVLGTELKESSTAHQTLSSRMSSVPRTQKTP
jgi:hypothetical protein